MDGEEVLGVVFIVCLFGFAAFGLVAVCAITAEGPPVTQRQAVAHGCAEWVLDPATGASEFRWKDEEPQP